MSKSPYLHRAAIIVGIDRYVDRAYPPLGCAVADAESIKHALVNHCGFAEENITLLLNEAATLQAIRRRAEAMGRAMRPERSQFVMFFAGHGETIQLFGTRPLGYLVPHDAESTSVFSTCFSMQDLIMLSQIVTAHHALFLLDSCFSGLVGVSTRGQHGSRFMRKLVSQRTRQILTAGMSSELAREDASLGHGFFTYCFCDALKNPPASDLPFLTATGLYAHITASMTTLTACKQTPQFRHLAEFGEGDNILIPLKRTRVPREEIPLSAAFRRLYCDEESFHIYSKRHPISFERVLPFRRTDRIRDVEYLIDAESALLTGATDDIRVQVISGLRKAHLLDDTTADHIIAFIDYFQDDFFELIGEIYSNKGMYKCALRWYREYIKAQEGAARVHASADESVYASVGYCLFSLGLFAEALAWTKSSMGPLPVFDSIGKSVLTTQLHPNKNIRIKTQRAWHFTRWTIRAQLLNQEWVRLCKRFVNLESFFERIMPKHRVKIDIETSDDYPWKPLDYPFALNIEGSPCLRHKLTLLYSSYNFADELTTNGETAEALQVLQEAMQIEPNANFIRDKLDTLEKSK